MKKVILLNGSAGVGKTTTSKMYLDEHPSYRSLTSVTPDPHTSKSP